MAARIGMMTARKRKPFAPATKMKERHLSGVVLVIGLAPDPVRNFPTSRFEMRLFAFTKRIT